MSYQPPMFRDRLCPHVFRFHQKHPNRREHFFDYGSPWSIDVARGEDPSKVCFKPLRCFRCPNSRKVLRATQPTLPLLPPNQYMHTDREPCLQTLQGHLRNCRHLVRCIDTFARAAKNAKVRTREVVTNKLLRIQEFKDGMEGNEGLRRLYEVECEAGGQMVIQSLQRLAMSGRKFLFESEAIYKKSYNDCYGGGCLVHLPPSPTSLHHHPGHLIFPHGPLMNHLRIHPIRPSRVSEKHQNKNEEEEEDDDDEEEEEEDDDEDSLYYKMDGWMDEEGGGAGGGDGLRLHRKHLSYHDNNPILQIHATHVNEYSLCAHRTTEGIYLFDLSNHLSHQPPSHHTLPRPTPILPHNSPTPSFVNLSPHIPGEIIYGNKRNEVFLWCLEERRTKLHTPPSSLPLSHLHFTNHNSIITLTTPQQLSLFDLRTPPLRPTQVLLQTQSKLFFPKESITTYHYPHHQATLFNHHPSPTLPHHHFIATETALCLLDQRVPGQAVLRWNHSLLVPPTLLSTLLSSPSSAGGDHLVCLGSQQWPEVHCHQFHAGGGGSGGDEEVQAHGLPWRVSKPLDFMTLMSRQGTASYDCYNDQRLHHPLVGLSVLPRRRGIAVLQLSSVGDLMGQDFWWASDLRREDKTCAMGPGSGGVRLTRRGETVAKKWLDQSSEGYFKGQVKRKGKREKEENGEEEKEEEEDDDDDDDGGFGAYGENGERRGGKKGGRAQKMVELNGGSIFSGRVAYHSSSSPLCPFCRCEKQTVARDDGDEEDEDEEEEEEGSDCEFLNYCKRKRKYDKQKDDTSNDDDNNKNNKNKNNNDDGMCKACGLSYSMAHKLLSRLRKGKLPSDGCDGGVISRQHEVGGVLEAEGYEDDDTNILIASFQQDDARLRQLLQIRSDKTKAQHDKILDMAEDRVRKKMKKDEDDEGVGGGDGDDGLEGGGNN